MARTIAAGDDLAIPFAVVDGVEAVSQRVVQRLRLFRGEAFLDADAGLDSDMILGRRLPSALVESIIAAEIRTVDGVDRVERVDVRLNAATRALRVAVRARAGDATVTAEVSL